MNKLTNFKSAGENFSTKPNHKFNPCECLAKCAQWKLNVTLTQNKSSTGLIFKGKGIFFKRLPSSVLSNLSMIDNISEISSFTMSNYLEKSMSDDLPCDFDSNVTFPLNNGDFNWMMTEMNYNNTQSLAHMMFMEFDILNSEVSKEHLKSLQEINDDFVEKEIHFVLNATIHGKSLFKQDLRFTAEARKIIKSMQQRLESYKTEFLEKKKIIQKSNPNFEIKNSKNNFFTRVISNQNIGIAFCKPNFDTIESFATNFNAIVNSGIYISKIYFEFSLPTQMLQNKNLIENRTKSNYENSYYDQFDNNPQLGLNKNYSHNNHTSWKGSYYTVEKSFSENNFHQKKRPQTGREFSIYDTQNSYSHKNKNYKNNENRKGSNYNKSGPGVYDNFYNTKYQPGYNNYSNYNVAPTNNYYQETGPSKIVDSGSIYKEQIFEKPKFNSNNNLLNFDPILPSTKNFKSTQSLQALYRNYEGMCNFILFAKSCSVHVLRSETHLIDDIKINNFFKNFEKVSAFGLDSHYPSEEEIISVNYSPSLSSMEIIFSDSVTYDKIIQELMTIRLIEPDKFIDNQEFPTENPSGYDSFNFKRLQQNLYKFEYRASENLKFLVYEKKIKLEYYENKPPHSRLIFTENLQEILNSLECLNSIELGRVDKSSWFCINWLPIKSSKVQLASTSFLTYYGFCFSDVEMFYSGSKSNLFLEIPVIGILPVKFDESFWLKKISKNKVNLNTSYTSNLLDFKMALSDSVNNVHEFIYSNTDRTSNDYEFYIKSM